MSQPLVNIHRNVFDVSLSFPGESRDYVRPIAERLFRELGPNRVFYDDFYKSQLALPNLDTALQALYRNRSRLLVAFLSGHYSQKMWCGIEFKAIRSILADREDQRVMFVRCDAGDVEGVFPQDGFIDARSHSPEQVADFIVERVQLLDPIYDTIWEIRGIKNQKINTARFLKNGRVELERPYGEAIWRRLDEHSILFGYGVESSFIVFRAEEVGSGLMSGYHYSGKKRHLVKIDNG